jgi:quercetin dioxygenase-like cupin family protein
LILITHGGYRVGIDPQRVFDAEAGDLVIMRPETDHAWTTVGQPRGAAAGIR